MKNLVEAIHLNALRHGWWDCKTCKGGGTMFAEYAGSSGEKTERPITCPVCHGTGGHRDDAESLALIQSEASEALESLREPDKQTLCDKCDGDGRVGPTSHSVMCSKCNGSGVHMCGTRLAEELADIVIRVFDLAQAKKIDIIDVIEKKHAFNINRPYKHGKAF